MILGFEDLHDEYKKEKTESCLSFNLVAHPDSNNCCCVRGETPTQSPT